MHHRERYSILLALPSFFLTACVAQTVVPTETPAPSATQEPTFTPTPTLAPMQTLKQYPLQEPAPVPRGSISLLEKLETCPALEVSLDTSGWKTLHVFSSGIGISVMYPSDWFKLGSSNFGGGLFYSPDNTLTEADLIDGGVFAIYVDREPRYELEVYMHWFTNNHAAAGCMFSNNGVIGMLATTTKYPDQIERILFIERDGIQFHIGLISHAQKPEMEEILDQILQSLTFLDQPNDISRPMPH